MTTTSPISTPSSSIRLARLSDHARMAQIFTLAFWDEPLFGKIIHPYREKYPTDMDLYSYRSTRVNWWDWTHRFVVTTTVDPKTKAEVVTGLAEWARLGEQGRRMWGLAWWDPRNLLQPLANAYNQLSAWLNPNRAADPKYEDILERGFPFFQHVWSGARAESWYLEMLAVDPAYQGEGLGRALVQWGLDQAEKEGVCASVISAEGNDSFYQRCGFDVQDHSAGDGEGNPLKNVPGGAIFWREPKDPR